LLAADQTSRRRRPVCGSSRPRSERLGTGHVTK
jgi:hypothetical protein